MLAWLASDLHTGNLLDQVPGFTPDWPLRETIGAADTGTGTLMLDEAPEKWDQILRAGACVLHCYDDADEQQTPLWSGIVWRAERLAAADQVQMSMSTGPSYFSARKVGDYTTDPTGTGATKSQGQIVSDLVSQFAADTDGVPFTVTVQAAGTARTRTYHAYEFASLYDRLQQLSAVIDGPEWTVRWNWSDDHEQILPELIVGTRLGMAIPSGLGPNAVFDMPGCLIDASLVDDYTPGSGANHVQAYSSGIGDSTPVSTVHTAAFDGRPRLDYAWMPSSSITDVSTLNDYAKQAVAVLAPGAQAVTLTADLSSAPKFGSEWNLGDDVGYILGGLDDHGRDTVKAFPGGLSGVGRVLARELSDTTISPILAQASVYTDMES